MLRFPLLVLCLVLSCVITSTRAQAESYDTTALMAAARAADQTYQRQIALLGDQTHSPDLAIRLGAISHLAQLVDPETLQLVLPFLQTARPAAEQEAAAVAAGHIGSVIAVPALRELLDHADAPPVREAALNALEQINSAQPQDYMTKVKDPDPVLNGTALTDLGTMAYDKATDALVWGLSHDRRQLIRRMCAIGLGRIGDRNQGPALLDALGDADPGVRRYAAEALVKLNYTPAIPHLLLALEGNIAGAYINHCLSLMTNQDFGFDWRASEVARADAVEKGFRWWTDHAAELSK